MNEKIGIGIFLVVALVTLAMFAGYGEANQVIKPTVGYVPPQWYMSDDDSYLGFLEYTDEEDSDFVWILYYEVPLVLKGKENDEDALISRATTFDKIDETGTMTVANQLAGYAKSYDSESDCYNLEIVFVKDTTCVDIYTYYGATSYDEDQVMSLIQSISVSEGNTPVATPTPEETPSPSPSSTSTPSLSPTPTLQTEIDSDSDGVPDENDYAANDGDVQTKGDVETPGFGVVFAVGSLLVVVFGVRRR